MECRPGTQPTRWFETVPGDHMTTKLAQEIDKFMTLFDARDSHENTWRLGELAPSIIKRQARIIEACKKALEECECWNVCVSDCKGKIVLAEVRLIENE